MEFDVNVDTQKITVVFTIDELAHVAAALRLAGWETHFGTSATKYEEMFQDITAAMSTAKG